MDIVEIKAAKVQAFPGVFAWIAEATVDDEETGDRLYVTVQEYGGCEYTVSGDSVYRSLVTGDGEHTGSLVEELDDARRAKKSKYCGIYEKLSDALKLLR